MLKDELYDNGLKKSEFLYMARGAIPHSNDINGDQLQEVQLKYIGWRVVSQLNILLVNSSPVRLCLSDVRNEQVVEVL